MENQEIPPSSDYSTAVPLEISQEIAEAADNLLRGFAEEADLDTALIVDRSGSLLAGVSAETEVTIDTISALVAGAGGAVRALAEELGDTGELESLHHGGDNVLYLREVANRFILVGVAPVTVSPGILREEASQLLPDLAELLRDVKPVELPAEPPKRFAKATSLRAVSFKEMNALVNPPAEEPKPVVEDFTPEGLGLEPVAEPAEPPIEEPPIEEPPIEEPPIPETPLTEPSVPELSVPEPPEVEVSADPSGPPRQILEPIDSGESEIVFEGGEPEERPVIDSPFEIEEIEETDELDEASGETVASPFELAEEDDDDVESSDSSPQSEEVFELVDEGQAFAEDDDQDDVSVFELVDGEDEEEEADESEPASRPSGPLYF